MDMMRHVAKVANTDQRCVVAFMQIPGREDHALVIPVDNLPPRFEQAVMQVLKTPEGQQEETFANALHRHKMPDTGDNIFKTLHENGKLVAVPVANILMLPRPNQPVKLTFILEQLGRLPKQVPDAYVTEKFNPHTNNQHANATQNNRAIAQGILMEAEMLEAEAKKKRDIAYAKDPSLRPMSNMGVMQPTPPAPTVIPISNGGLDDFFAPKAPMAVDTDSFFNPPVAMPEVVAGPSPLELRMQALEENLAKIAASLTPKREFVPEVSQEPEEKERPKKRQTLKENNDV